MKLYTVELLDNAGKRLALLENTKAPTYTRRRNQATQVSFSVPRSDDKTSLIQLAARFNLYRRGTLLFGGVITKRNLSKDPWTFEGFSREIDLETMLTPAYWTWRDKDLADIFRGLTLKFKTRRWAQKADFEIGARENVDTETMPGNVILQKGEDLHYPAAGYVTSGIIDLATGEVYPQPTKEALAAEVDESGYSSGTLQGVQASADGFELAQRQTLLFDGVATKVDTGFQYNFGTGPFTLEAWIWLDPLSSGTRPIINKIDILSINFRLGIDSNGCLKLNTGNLSSTTPYIVPTGKWVHVAGVRRSSGVLSLYINGVEYNSDPMEIQNTNSSENVSIGFSIYFALFFKGRIRDVRIWDIERSAAEISGNMYTDFTSNPPAGLVGLYPLDEGSGSIAYDRGAEPAHNGTITDAVWAPSYFNHGSRIRPALTIPDIESWLIPTWDAIDPGDGTTLTAEYNFDGEAWAECTPGAVITIPQDAQTFNLRWLFTSEDPDKSWIVRNVHIWGRKLLPAPEGDLVATRFERIRWAERIGTKVRHTVQFRASDLREYDLWPDWSPEMTPEIDPLYGVDLVRLGLSTIHRYAEIRFNLYTDDTETPHKYEEGAMPTAYGLTPILGPFELVYREPSGLSAAGVPDTLGIEVLDYGADRAKHLAVAADLAEKHGVEFRVDAAGVLTVAPAIGVDRSGEIVAAAEHNVNIDELGDALADVVNVLTVLGAGEGIAQLQTELRDEDSIRIYGERHGVVTNKDIYDWADLLEWGAAELAKRARPDWKFKVRMAGIPDHWPEFGLGDTITAVHPKLGIRVKARILEEQRKEDNGEVITLGLNSELDVAVRRFFRAIAEKEALAPRETVPLPAPTGLVAAGRISEAVLQWVHAGADTYEIFHSYDGEEFSLIDTVPGTQKTYTHKALGIRTGHYYKVRAVKDGVPSALSQVAYAFVDRLAGTAIEPSSMPASVFDVPLAGMIGRMGRNRILSGLQMQQPAFMRYELPAVQDATVRYLNTGISTDHSKNEAAYLYSTILPSRPSTLIRIPYIRWDLSGVTGNVISAQISLYCNGKNVSWPDYWPKLCKVLGGWDEATITYNNKPNFEHIISIPFSHISVGNRVLITGPSILSLVYGWLNGTIQNHGICIDMNTGGNNNFVSFATRHEAQTYQPLLILETQQPAVDRIVRVSSGIVKIANNFYYVPAFEIEAPDNTTSYLFVTMESEGVFSHQFKPTPELSPNDVGIGKVTAAGGVLTDVEMSAAAGRIDGAFDWSAFGLSGTYGDLPDSAGLVYVGEFKLISTTVSASWTHNMGTGMLLVGMLFKDNAGTILQMCSIAVNNSSAGITVDMSDPNVITATATSAGVHYDKVNNMTYAQGMVAPIFLAIGQGL